MAEDVVTEAMKASDFIEKIEALSGEIPFRFTIGRFTDESIYPSSLIGFHWEANSTQVILEFDYKGADEKYYADILASDLRGISQGVSGGIRVGGVSNPAIYCKVYQDDSDPALVPVHSVAWCRDYSILEVK